MTMISSEVESKRANIHSPSICATPTMCFVLGTDNTKMHEPSSLLLKRMYGHKELCTSRVLWAQRWNYRNSILDWFWSDSQRWNSSFHKMNYSQERSAKGVCVVGGVLHSLCLLCSCLSQASLSLYPSLPPYSLVWNYPPFVLFPSLSSVIRNVTLPFDV